MSALATPSTGPGASPGRGTDPAVVPSSGPSRRRGRRSRWRAAFGTPLGAAGLALLLLVLVTAVAAPLVWGDRAAERDTGDILAGPSAEHWAGTDNLGRDIFFRVLVATRLSVELTLVATALAVVVGLLLGTAPALLGRRAGRLVTAAVNIAVAFPGILLALFFAVVFGVGAIGAVLAIGLAGAPSFARLCQTSVAAVAGRDFVSAARIAGVGRVRLLLRHLLPNIGEPLVVNATIGAGGALLAFAGLSFLGLGVQNPQYDWGRLLQDGVNRIYVTPVPALVAGAAVVLAGLAFNLVGEALAKGLGVPVVGAAGVRAPRPAPGPEATTPASGPATDPDVVLEVADLSITFPGPDGDVRAVRGVGLVVRRGEAVGIVGESGSGKSLTALAVAGLVDLPGRVEASRLRFAGQDPSALTDAERRHLLGTSLAMVFQDPQTSFNPTQRIGHQLAEVSRHHAGLSRRAAFDRAVDRLAAVRVPAARRRAHQYPHEFSGGMRQRAMIGMGLMGSPRLVLADEPTTALDVTVQAQVLDLLDEVRAADDAAIVLISHDISVIQRLCDRVLVMYAGRIVEDLPVADLGRARHPYTRALVAAVPHLDTALDRPLPVIAGRPPDPARLPTGCAYAPRCPLADERCRAQDPPVVDGAACWHPGEPLPPDGVHQ